MKKYAYVIKDQEGNFVSDRAFVFFDGWNYLTYTGKTTGFTWNTKREVAEEDLKKLQSINNKYGFCKTFKIEEVNLANIPNGELVIKAIELAAA